jgi:hypothetical protein
MRWSLAAWSTSEALTDSCTPSNNGIIRVPRRRWNLACGILAVDPFRGAKSIHVSIEIREERPDDEAAVRDLNGAHSDKIKKATSSSP